jgi:hypothetical protein
MAVQDGTTEPAHAELVQHGPEWSLVRWASNDVLEMVATATLFTNYDGHNNSGRPNRRRSTIRPDRSYRENSSSEGEEESIPSPPPPSIAAAANPLPGAAASTRTPTGRRALAITTAMAPLNDGMEPHGNGRRSSNLLPTVVGSMPKVATPRQIDPSLHGLDLDSSSGNNEYSFSTTTSVDDASINNLVRECLGRFHCWFIFISHTRAQHVSICSRGRATTRKTTKTLI